jgi:hypothetical protein
VGVSKLANPPIDSLHLLPCFLTGVAGRSTSSDIELVTTFSDETNWSIISTGLLVMPVGMLLVSNRSNRRERFLLIIFVVSLVRSVISPRHRFASNCGGVCFGRGGLRRRQLAALRQGVGGAP